MLGRRAAPFTPLLIPYRVPHGFTQDPSSTDPKTSVDLAEILPDGAEAGLRHFELSVAQLQGDGRLVCTAWCATAVCRTITPWPRLKDTPSGEVVEYFCEYPFV